MYDRGQAELLQIGGDVCAKSYSSYVIVLLVSTNVYSQPWKCT
jgi:hypothetical protein